jgi:hypothetical protein
MSSPAITINLRIPGQWKHPGELLKSIPPSYQLTPETLILKDGTSIEMNILPSDKKFFDIFSTSCRKPATPEEMVAIKNFTVNICLSGPGGSLEAALRMMEAASVILQAGGAGVFIDNSTVAHGATTWLAMTEDGGSDALSFAFVAIVQATHEVYTLGMHVLGFREIVMKRADLEEDEDFDIVDVIRYVCAEVKPIKDSHVIADLEGPRFRCDFEPSSDEMKGSVLHNPFGRMRLVSLKDLAKKAEQN